MNAHTTKKQRDKQLKENGRRILCARTYNDYKCWNNTRTCEHMKNQTKCPVYENKGAREMEGMNHIFEEIAAERKRQDEKWGEQNHIMCDAFITGFATDRARAFKNRNTINKSISWFSILMEEVYEAFAETDPAKQRTEMVQVAAVAVQIIEYLDRRIGK